MAIPITVLDCDLLLYGRGHRTLDRFKLDDVTDEYLMSMYGFPRQFIYFLVELLGASLSRPTQRSRAISPETQILAALGFYTSGSFQTRMGDAIGISQASMSRCVANVTEALVERASQFIHFPVDEAAVQSLKDKGALQYSPEKCSHIILACCVLHNISLDHGMDVWSSPVPGPIDQPPEGEDEHMESLDLEADRIRQELILTHFS